MTQKKTVLHVITNLGLGGAESILYRLVNTDTVNNHVVVSLIGEGVFGKRLRNCGATVHILGMRGFGSFLPALIKLRKLMRNHQPDVVQTWMYHADFLGGLAAKSVGHKHIVWNIRHSDLKPEKTKKSTILIAKACARLSYWVPEAIICCAYRAQAAHLEMGYDPARMVVIQNGLELDKWKLDEELGYTVRRSLGIPDDAFVIGAVGRFTPEKNHSGLVEALSNVQQKVDCHILFVGEGMEPSNTAFVKDMKKHGLNNVHLAGRRNDIVAIMNSLDLHVMASDSEGFPNVITEAMACSTPCVATDAGDARHIIDGAGWVVPVGDMQAFAVSVEDAHNLSRDAGTWSNLKSKCREHIATHFEDGTMLARYHKVWNCDKPEIELNQGNKRA